MFEKISVLVPTRGRVERLRAMIASFDRTTGNLPNAELVFRCDDDDPATIEFLRAWGGHQIVVGPRLAGYDSMPAYFNELAEAATGDVLMCGNDDMVFKTEGWPARLLFHASSRYPDGLFNLGVVTLNAEHFPFSTVSRKMVDAMGFLWDPRIFWGDIFLRDVAGLHGRAALVDDVEIEHAWAGYTPDDTFAQADKDIVRRNPTYWTSVHMPAVADAVVKVKELLA